MEVIHGGSVDGTIRCSGNPDPALRKSVLAAVLAMGFSGLVAEILLLRELLIVFSGNELSIGIILANWMILEAVGCYGASRKPEQESDTRITYVLITLLFSLFLIVSVYVTRNLRNLLGVSIGETIGFLPMLYCSFMILLPVSILHGALFTICCRLQAETSGEAATAAGRAYVHETIGTIIGGLACTYLLIPYAGTFQITVWLALFNAVICFWLLSRHRCSRPLYRHMLIALSIVVLIAAGSLLTGGVEKLHRHTIGEQWRQLNVRHYQNSQYGNICVVENEGQYIFFLDGIATIIMPIPDIPLIEEFVNIPLLSHPDPRNILILGGGAGGVINEVLKHPTVTHIDYAEQDPLLIGLFRRFSTPLTRRELTDSRVRIHAIDGRLHLRNSRGLYDLIFVGVSEPANLQANRYFTFEFFRLARNRLKPDGILVLGLPGSLSYLNDELRNVNSSVFYTLHNVFDHVRVIPGNDRNLFLASAQETYGAIDAEQMMSRVVERGLASDGFLPWHIEQKLHPGWQDWFGEFIAGSTRKINHDFKPIALYHILTHWNALYSPAFGRVFRSFGTLRLRDAALALLALGASLLLWLKIRPGRRTGISVAIISTGFAGMIFNLVVIFSFQVMYGNIFSWIGLLVAAFMTGAALGAMLITHALDRIQNHRNLFFGTEWALILFAAGLPVWIIAVQAWAETDYGSEWVIMLFPGIALIAGALIGVQFPLANRINLERNFRMSETAARLYAADLIGGWFGGIIGSVVLMPVLGLAGTCLIVALLKIISFVIIKMESARL